MQTKLTLRLDSHLIDLAKQHAELSGKSLSRLVSDYFYLLQPETAKPSKSKLPPITQSLKGVLKSSSPVNEDMYSHHLEKKYL